MTDTQRKPPRRRPGAMLRRFISVRRVVQITFGLILYLAVAQFGIGLGWVLLGGSAAGILFGKFFCRWMCPMGAVMEMMLGRADEEGRKRNLYNYFKLGCPIAWAGGLLNRFSLVRVVVDPNRCTHCNLCDKACYVAELAPGHSLHSGGWTNASTHYSCSRCLSCVSACRTGALSVGIASLGRAIGARDDADGEPEGAPARSRRRSAAGTR